MSLIVFCVRPAVGEAPALSAARAYAETELRDLLVDRSQFYDYKITRSAGGATIKLKSRRAGAYDIHFGGVTNPVGPAPDVTVTPRYLIKGHVTLPTDWALDPTRATNRVRGLLRADPYLHPMNQPAGLSPRPTPPQLELLRQLKAKWIDAKSRDEVMRSLVLMPPGLGKTVIAGLFARDLDVPERPVTVIFIVESKNLLNQATDKIGKILGLSGRQIRRYYGDHPRGDLFAGDPRLITISRSGANRRLDDLIAGARARNGHVVVVFDEAQHVGKKNGQFERIIDRCQTDLRPGDAMIALSATPWHVEMGAIYKAFGHSLVAAMVTDAERDEYLSTGRFIELARLILFRAIDAGYLSPLYDYRHVEVFSDGTSIPTRDFLNDSAAAVSSLDARTRSEVFKRNTRVHEGFAQTMLDDIHRTIPPGPVRYFNRGVIFVPSIAHADAYVKMLNEKSGPDGVVRVRALHSALPEDADGSKALAWFDQVGGEHRYLIAVDMASEGFDRPGLNHIMMAKAYSRNDPVGMRTLLQHLGRLVRVGTGKTRTFVTDYTGDMQRLLFAGLPHDLLDALFVSGSPTPREDFWRRTNQRTTTFDGQTLADAEIKSRTVLIPAQELAVKPMAAAKPAPVAPSSATKYEPWTLARLLVDPRIIPQLLPLPRLSKPPATTLSLANVLCMQIQNTWPLPQEENRSILYGLLNSLGIDYATFVRRGYGEKIKHACLRGALKMSHRPRAKTVNVNEVTRAAAALISNDPGLFGRLTNFTDLDLQPNPSLVSRVPLVPWTGEAEQIGVTKGPRPEPRRWSLAELLLNPLVARGLRIESSNLARMLVRGTFEGADLSMIEDFRGVTWLDTLRGADVHGWLTVDSDSYLLDPFERERAVERLITVNPKLFGQLVNFTDAHLIQAAGEIKSAKRNRWLLDGYLLSRGVNPSWVNPRDSSTQKFPPLGTIKLPDVDPRDLVNVRWHEPFTLARLIVHPILRAHDHVHPNELKNIRTHESYASAERRGLLGVTVGHTDPAALDRAERDLLAVDPEFFGQLVPRVTEESIINLFLIGDYEPLPSHARIRDYLRARGPLPNPPVAAPPEDANDRGDDLATDGWTLARLLVHPRALPLVSPDRVEAAGFMSPRNLGYYLCKQMNGRLAYVRPNELRAAKHALALLRLDGPELDARGWSEFLAHACRANLFEPNDEGRGRWTEDLLRQRELALIQLAPAIFGGKVTIGPDVFDAIIPPPRRKPDVTAARMAEWRRPLSLAALLFHPAAAASVGSRAASLAQELADGTFDFNEPRRRAFLVAAGVDERIWDQSADDALTSVVRRNWTIISDRRVRNLEKLAPDPFAKPTVMTIEKLLSVAKELPFTDPVRHEVAYALLNAGFDWLDLPCETDLATATPRASGPGN